MPEVPFNGLGIGVEGVAIDDRLIDDPPAKVGHEDACRLHVALADGVVEPQKTQTPPQQVRS
jgi:hypothetical protein